MTHRISRFLPIVGTITVLAGCASSATSPSRAPASPSLPAISSPPGSAGVLQDAFIGVVKRVGPSVVQIENSSGLGSGVIFDTKGDIVTNAHVVGTDTSFHVTFSDGKVKTATLVGSFAADDLAVIHVDVAGLPAAHFADSNTLQVGSIVMAIGNPLGLRSSVTEGIVSAVGRTVDEGNGNTLPSTIQTSAAINPGNSGGALVDLNGDVVGIPTLAATDPQLGGGAAPGIGFAIPSSLVSDIAGQIIAHGHVINSHRAYLGVGLSTEFFSGGVVVTRLDPVGPATKAGVVVGDQITSINGTHVDSPTTVTSAIADLQPGAHVSIGLLHQDGTTSTVTVTLGQLPGG